ncbi:MAG: hypothetical protein WDO71_19710 [Bacteroidota bacterium]
MESVCPKEKNKSGSVSIQIIDKSGGKFQIVKVVGCAKNADQQRALVQQAYDLLSQLTLQPRLDFSFSEDELFFTQLQHSLQKVVVIGPELILGNLFDQIGYDEIPGNLFRHLVITRLVYPAVN